MADFVHRDNYPLSSWDSICTRCYRTAGTRATEQELAEDEANHLCDPSDLERIRCVPNPKKKP